MKIEKQIRDCFGLGNRRLTNKEKEYIDKWCNDYMFDFCNIKLAYEHTIESIGKLSFSFLEKILNDWHEKKTNT